MAGTLFEHWRRVIGGIYSVSPSAASDGDNVPLRTNEYGEAVVAIGSTGTISIGADTNPGVGQAVTCSDVGTNRTTQLTVGTTYEIWCDVDCYIDAGTVAVTASSADFHLMARYPIRYTVTTDNDYIACLRMGATSGTMHVSVCR